MSITFQATTIEQRDWDGEIVDVHVPVADLEDLAFNLSNVNAADLLRFIGIEAEPCGTLTADQVLASCMLALEMREDEEDAGRRPRASVNRSDGSRGPLMIECGRDAGYLRERAQWLYQLAEAAKARGHSISWG